MTLWSPCMTTSTKVVNFILYSLDGSKSLTMSNVFVVEEVPYTYSLCRDLSAYPHLSDVPISLVHPLAKVDLLIGQDNSEALVPLQVLKSNPGDPFSVLTKFGWTLNSVVQVVILIVFLSVLCLTLCILPLMPRLKF